MGKRVLYFLEVLILLTIFSLGASFIITTYQNDAIVDATEDFVELARQKGCITAKMYDNLLDEMPTAVKVSFVIEKAKVLKSDDDPLDREFTQEVFDSIEDIGYYPMEVGDHLQIIVRKSGQTYFDSIVAFLTGTNSSESDPIIAIKGGLVLNEQYH